eukprot:3143192-Prymnesium_polylepis.1
MVKGVRQKASVHLNSVSAPSLNLMTPANKVAAASVILLLPRLSEKVLNRTSKSSHLIAPSLLFEEASRDSPKCLMPASPMELAEMSGEGSRGRECGFTCQMCRRCRLAVQRGPPACSIYLGHKADTSPTRGATHTPRAIHSFRFLQKELTPSVPPVITRHARERVGRPRFGLSP